MALNTLEDGYAKLPADADSTESIDNRDCPSTGGPVHVSRRCLSVGLALYSAVVVACGFIAGRFTGAVGERRTSDEFPDVSQEFIVDAFRTDKPIIGILTLPCLDFESLTSWCPPGKQAHLPASYVKWVESAGARVVPISHRWGPHELNQAIEHVNGLLLTGGNATYDVSYEKAVTHIVKRGVELYRAGDPFPIWGICLGFEAILTSVSHHGVNLLSHGFKTEGMMLKASFRHTSRMFGHQLLPSRGSAGLGPVYERWLAQAPLAYNAHSMAVLISNFASDPELNELFHAVATSSDPTDGRQFVAVIEGKRGLPIYGVQFHPEKPMFEWGMASPPLLHSPESISTSSYLAMFFASEARKSRHRFPDDISERNSLIFNYEPAFTHAYFEQIYFFTDL
eukprot:TRINITY_DN46851_c0_g1_i1.p1 TRINITY_DN46851_c0_g1~~TRINITY_DN46851_c0_g1_i1.p1  ORF type:complete len:396 (+),score=38.16 TRINITY_DN46851_c0_g1_i1:47-1234(+)